MTLVIYVPGHRTLLALHQHLTSVIITTEKTMVQIELVPDISHCIETVAKREYENLARDYLQTGKADSEFEDKAELLRTFLELANFKSLRKQSEQHLEYYFFRFHLGL